MVVGQIENVQKKPICFAKKENEVRNMMSLKKNHIEFSESWDSFRNWLQVQVLNRVPERPPGFLPA